MSDAPGAPEDRLRGNVLWFALGMMVMGAVGAVSFMVFLKREIRESVQEPSVISVLVGNADLQQGIAANLVSDFQRRTPEFYDSGLRHGHGGGQRRHTLGQYDVCFLTHVNEADGGDSACRVEKSGESWILETSQADCRASCIRWNQR